MPDEATCHDVESLIAEIMRAGNEEAAGALLVAAMRAASKKITQLESRVTELEGLLREVKIEMHRTHLETYEVDEWNDWGRRRDAALRQVAALAERKERAP